MKYSKVMQFYNTKNFVEHKKIIIKSYDKKTVFKKISAEHGCILKSITDRKFMYSTKLFAIV